MRFVDTHCHLALLHDDPVAQTRVIDEAKRCGVSVIVNISTNLIDFFSSYKNTKNIPNIFHTVGLSPSEVNTHSKDWVNKLEEGLTYEKIVGVGEIGLDYYHQYGDKKTQIELFIKQLDIASDHNLPVVIHNREAGNDMRDILKSKKNVRGIMHCFSEDIDFAKEMISLGFYISFAGNLTYRNAKNLHDVARALPIESIIIETDSPFLSPNSKRKERNKPANIVETAKYLAYLRGIDIETLSEILFQNSLKAFNITSLV